MRGPTTTSRLPSTDRGDAPSAMATHTATVNLAVIVFGVLFLAIGLSLTLMPATVARLDQAEQRALTGRQTSLTRYRPVAQRIAGSIPLVAGVVLIVVGALHR